MQAVTGLTSDHRDRLLRRSFHAGGQPAVSLVRAGLLIIWLQLNVSGFRLVLARGWHGHACWMQLLAGSWSWSSGPTWRVCGWLPVTVIACAKHGVALATGSVIPHPSQPGRARSNDSVENHTLLCRELLLTDDSLVAQAGELLQHFSGILCGDTRRSGHGWRLPLEIMDLSR